MAAEWIADHLPRVSPKPFANLCDEECGELRVRVFVLGGVSASDQALRRCLAREPSDPTEGSSLLPLRTFLQGLYGPTDVNGNRRMLVEDRRKLDAGEGTPRLELYAGEDFLMLRLPSFLPLRLFWCSLSLQSRENLIYMYGSSLPLRFEQGAHQAFSSEEDPVPAYRCAIAGRWMFWGPHFSWAQGEERVRMLGHSLSRGVTARGSGVTEADRAERLHEGIAGFLKQTAMPQRET
jgi:hypothetical protein